MNARDKAKQAADVVNEALEAERELEAPARGLVGLLRRWVRRIKARRARKHAPTRPLSQRDVDETKPQRRVKP